MQKLLHGVGIAVASSLLVAACGDDEAADSTTQDSESSTTEESGTTDDTGQAATGEALLVGFVNMEGSALSFPDTRVGAELGAAYVNAELNGVGGRPIEYVRCDTDGSPEASIDCANRFVEAGVALVQMGIDLGSDAMLPILTNAGIPLVGVGAYGPEQQQSDTAFFISIASAAGFVGPLQFFADEGAERISFLVSDDPVSREAVESVAQPVAEDLGIDLEAVFYDAAAADFNVLAATAMTGNPDVIGVAAAPEPLCTAFVSAVRGAGFSGDVFAAGCSDYREALGEQADGVVTRALIWRPDDLASAPPGKQDEIEIYLDAIEAAGRADLESYIPAATLFANTVDIARILSTIDGPIDGEAVVQAMRATVDYDSFLGPQISCDGTAWPGTNACGNSMLFYETQPDGTVVAATDEFVELEAPTVG